MKRPKAHSTRAAGFWIAVLAYFGLSFASPLALSVPLWAGLAFVGLPAVIGAIAAKGTSGIESRGQRFRGSFWICSWTVFLYAAVNLMIAHHRMGASAAPGSVFLLGLAVACTYALIAGVVGGMAGALLFARTNHLGGKHEPASRRSR